jgi:hypothetical protein
MSTRNTGNDPSGSTPNESSTRSEKEVERLFDRIAASTAEAIFKGRQQEKVWRKSKGIDSAAN